MSPAQQKVADDRAVAQVEATNHAPAPLRPVMPQALAPAFVAQHAAGGKSCAFVAKGETAAIALALDGRIELQIDGQPAVFSADKGSARLPSGAWSRYLGKALVLALDKPGAGSPIARLVINDRYNRPVFEAGGKLRCPAI
ncbi:hypothetical protein [Novosphingobium sp.]|uniref:hypothetical protein n=1 Tax=Novosphingobium sp. TaxID=1874826 RepID=UPI0025F6C475|nr:hypothetical protein [Novosphingobium sp.]